MLACNDLLGATPKNSAVLQINKMSRRFTASEWFAQRVSELFGFAI